MFSRQLKPSFVDSDPLLSLRFFQPLAEKKPLLYLTFSLVILLQLVILFFLVRGPSDL